MPIEKTLVQLEARVAPLSNLCKEVIRSIEKRPFFPKSALAQEAEPPAKPNGSERDHRLESKRKCRAFWFIHIWQMGWVAVGGLFFYIFGPRLAGLLANDLDQTRRAGCMRERKGFPRRPSANPALI